jgi:UDP-N-acetylglucosamine transferase subunit ALG13
VIFVTVGTQLPFDRLVQAVDAWAGTHASEAETSEPAAFAQIGATAYRPRHMEWADYLPAAQFRQKLEAASLIVSHAGMGNLLMAMQAQKPILVMPRRAALNETRNDHQLATATWLRQLPGIIVADDIDELTAALQRSEWQAPQMVRADASPELLAAVRAFIEEG